jgi:hypothetical protein
MAAMEDKMLSDVLTSLREVRVRLQCQLAQRPEYRALLIVDRAAAQLTEEFHTLDSLATTHRECDATEDAPLPNLISETASEPDWSQRENTSAHALVETAAPLAAPPPPPFGRQEAAGEDAAVHPIAPMEKPTRTSSRAIDLFLSSTAQAVAPASASARPRSYLPFVAPALPVKSAAAN